MINGINRSYQQPPALRRSQQAPRFGYGALIYKNGEKLEKLSGDAFICAENAEYHCPDIHGAINITVEKAGKWLGFIPHAKVYARNDENWEHREASKHCVARKIGIHKDDVAFGVIEKAVTKLQKKLNEASEEGGGYGGGTVHSQTPLFGLMMATHI